MRGAIHSLPQYAFMACCSVKEKHRDNFTFTFMRCTDLHRAAPKIVINLLMQHCSKTNAPYQLYVKAFNAPNACYIQVNIT